MAKGELTRQRIIERAAPVFNTLGYSGTSMSELTRATGLEKGGIYNHFPSKEALALAAFDYAVQVVAERFRSALEGVEPALARLDAMVQVFGAYLEEPPLPGGCPILNTAVEADDTEPALRERAQAAMTDLQKLIGVTVKVGVARGELRPDTDPRAVAAVLTATMEGAIMLARLYGDPAPLRHALAHARWYIGQLAAP
jgi:TetR/AcrR family transcriptional repressor of nem operon